MFYTNQDYGLETKFASFDGAAVLKNGCEISGYASVFGQADQSGDVVQTGAYKACLQKLAAEGRSVKMLWQHDPTKPIGVWDEIHEDGNGLFVKGRLLPEIQGGSEALALIKAGAIDGLSIGYRTLKAEKSIKQGRLLHELELWEVSLVTFPMLPQARVIPDGKADDELANELAAALNAARLEMLA
ncbi:MAG: HK97 family phage prohead protease [Proteobacteria bacterium]|nr:HK97 family phage prohead protease [Pseudomonadota bacterium]